MTETTKFVLFGIDAGLTHFINSFSGQTWIADQLMLAISWVGVPLMVFAVAAQWWSRINRIQSRYVALTAGFSFLLALAFNQVIVLFVQRARPYEVGVSHLLGSRSLDPSFPSDHATAAFAIAFAFLFKGESSKGSIFAMCAVFISLSRIYIGTHYIGDVLGGGLTAFTAAILLCLVYRQNSFLNRRLTSIL